MKKIIAVILIVVFTFLFTACSNSTMPTQATNLETTEKSTQENNLIDVSSGVVTLGEYGGDSIVWKVLTQNDGNALIISEKLLTRMPFKDDVSGTWETCSLRKWLNEDFYNQSFTNDEKSSIITSKVTATQNPEYNTDQGNHTEDNVFLLSIDEVNKYFTDDNQRVAHPTERLKEEINSIDWEMKVSDNESEGWRWWLRTMGDSINRAAWVSPNGGIVFGGSHDIANGNSGVRPAMWIKCKSVNNDDIDNFDNEETKK